ncbi:hypothetical protein [Bradyrhizobium sp. Ec3.3]|uniref:hypothetical protein n=1 Tax=Bradyrhizobium sp. Ec3.3 TaxID=189753 RepID=UPI00040D6670|nr:hypothetical protein [Bradyrhizobium sp. Ec3.3]
MPAPAITPDTIPVPALPIRRPFGLLMVLFAVAALEAFDGLSSVSTLFGDMSEIPGPGLGGFLIKAHIATHPVLALAALACAAMGHLRGAILALAAIIMMTWLNHMPSVVLHGFDVAGIGAFQTPAEIIAFPLMAACAIACALRNQRLALATLLVSVPTLFNMMMLVAFAVGVAIYGF